MEQTHLSVFWWLFFFLMHLFERYIDMGDGQPIWHCFCRFSPEKHEQLESEVKHMLENYIAVPSCKAGPHHVYWWLNQIAPLGYALTFRKVNTNKNWWLCRSSWLCDLDVLKTYWLVLVSKCAQEVASSITAFGLLKCCCSVNDVQLLFFWDWWIQWQQVWKDVLFICGTSKHSLPSDSKSESMKFAKATVASLSKVVGHGRAPWRSSISFHHRPRKVFLLHCGVL